MTHEILNHLCFLVEILLVEIRGPLKDYQHKGYVRTKNMKSKIMHFLIIML